MFCSYLIGDPYFYFKSQKNEAVFRLNTLSPILAIYKQEKIILTFYLSKMQWEISIKFVAVSECIIMEKKIISVFQIMSLYRMTSMVLLTLYHSIFD